MPTWGHILVEISETEAALQKKPAAERKHSPFDLVRRKYLASVAQHTKRAAIVYATRFMQPALVGQITPPELMSLTNEDIHGFMEAVHGLEGDSLDLILHSPGGSAEVAEAILTYLRSKFSDIRVVVPLLAKSAATMLACGAEKIVMGKHSFLGPIDPQIVLNTSLGVRLVPAQAMIEQFEKAKKECTDPAALRAWMPMLSQYGPDLLVASENASAMAKELVGKWLEAYMFKGEKDAATKAIGIAAWLADHKNFKSHSRNLSRDELRARGLKVDPLEADHEAQDLFLSVFHATAHTFSQTGATKIIENHRGKAYVRMLHSVIIPSGPPPSPPNLPKP